MKIAVFFGGKSCEHNVSVATGVTIANAIKEHGHDVICVYVDKCGKWWTGKKLFDIKTYKRGGSFGRAVSLRFGESKLVVSPLKKIAVDCAVICNHGKNGEDGSIQGALQLSGIPFTGSDVLGSAIGMDKITMKRLFRYAKIPTVASVVAYKHQSLNQIAEVCCKKLSFPMIVKPSNLGSSIGIEVAHDKGQLMFALNVAFEWDESVVIEQALTNFTEYNCAVIGDRESASTGAIEQPSSSGEFLSYQQKYHSGQKSPSSDRFPKLDIGLEQKIRALTVRAFDSVCASGVARMDFLLDNDTGKLYANEINTVPGSLAYYLFPDLSIGQLADKLIALALKRKGAQDLLRYTYEDSSFAKKYK